MSKFEDGNSKKFIKISFGIFPSVVEHGTRVMRIFNFVFEFSYLKITIVDL